MKTFEIEVQRLKSVRHDKGMVEITVDAAVSARRMGADENLGSCMSIPVEHARTLLLLLKQQLLELDRLQPRSRRSGRA